MNSRRKDFCRTPFLWKSVISEGMLINRIPPLLKMHHRIPRELPVDGTLGLHIDRDSHGDAHSGHSGRVRLSGLLIVDPFLQPQECGQGPLRKSASAKGGAIKTNRPWAVIFDPSVNPAGTLFAPMTGETAGTALRRWAGMTGQR